MAEAPKGEEVQRIQCPVCGASLQLVIEGEADALAAEASPAPPLKRRSRGVIGRTPELVSFIEQRAPTDTIIENRDAICAAFPAELHVSKSAIHRYLKGRSKPSQITHR